MELTKERQKETGAFYTPKMWADLAVKYIMEVVPNMEDYLFWDMAAGEGALLEALPDYCEKYATTLESEDVDILRSKGITANQFDFLDGDLKELVEINGNEHRLIVFTNPPYVKLSADNNSYAKVKYQSNNATALFYYRILKEIKPVMICGFNKLDLYQSSTHERFRNETMLYERTIKLFGCPSKSWGLKGNFPIMFNIILAGGEELCEENVSLKLAA